MHLLMFLVLFTLFCITTSSTVPQPAGQPPVCWTEQRPDWNFNTKGGKSPKGWCDRILYLTKGNIETYIQPSDYNAIGNWAIAESDHDLVAAYYTIFQTEKHKKGPKKGKKKKQKIFNVLSVTFNIGDYKTNDEIEKRFNAIMCSLKAKYVTKWEKIDIFHFAFQEAKAWWNKQKKDWRGKVLTEAKPEFDFATTLTTQVPKNSIWEAKYKYEGKQGALLYVYYNAKKVKHQPVSDSVNEYSSGHFTDMHGGEDKIKKSFTMLGHFYNAKDTKKQAFVVFATAHFPKENDAQRIEALKQIENKFSKYNVNKDNVILILGADTNFRVDNTHIELKEYLKGGSKADSNIKNWKEITAPTFKQTCKRMDKVKLYQGKPECTNSNTPKNFQCWSTCTAKGDAIIHARCTKDKSRRKAKPQKKTKQGCKKNKARVLCDIEIPTCDKDKNAPECLSKVVSDNANGENACKVFSRPLKTQESWKWEKPNTIGVTAGHLFGKAKASLKRGIRFLCGKKTVGSDITPWNDNNHIYNPSTSSSYYMYFMTMAILLMIIILCGIFGLCVGSICFVGAYYYGQRSVKKVNQMDEKYP